jgi:hypothetical protein
MIKLVTKMMHTVRRGSSAKSSKKGMVASDPQVPGIFGKNPLPKTDKISLIRACI